MLEKIKIENNKETFINLVKSIDREGTDIQGLIDKLENSDFFIAPASVRYFGSYDGGLCEYALKTYEIMKSKAEVYGIDTTSAKIVSLFYSFYKMNFYIKDTKNVKVYSDYGTKTDNHGRYDWESQEYYRVKEAEDRFVYGTNGETCEFMLRYFIPLTVEESRAILNATRNTEDGQNFLAEVYSISPLTVALQTSILEANYLTKNE